MQPLSVAACLFVALLLAGGQVLFKYAAADIARHAAAASWVVALMSPWLVAAVLVYGLSTVLWIAILTQEPLSRAYPFVLAGAVAVPAYAHFVFGEPISAKFWVGLALVSIGLLLTQIP